MGPVSTGLEFPNLSRNVVSADHSCVAPALFQGVPIVCPQPEKELFTDASLTGWGAHLDGQMVSGVWDSTQSSLHINLLELEAVSLALIAFRPSLEGRHVRIHTDNTTVASYVNKQGGTRSPSLSDKACLILTWCNSQRILLSAVYLKGSLNVFADNLSRGDKVVHSEWTLSHQSLDRLWSQIDKPVIDLFATRFSARLPLFVSPFPDPLAWKVNALEINWTNLTAYAFPPFCLLGKVLRKVDLEKPALVLVAPLWPSQHWFPDLLRLAVRPPIPLAVKKGDLVQPRSGIPHGNPRLLSLHAWILSEALCLRQGPLCPLQNVFVMPIESQRLLFTHLTGRLGLGGSPITLVYAGSQPPVLVGRTGRISLFSSRAEVCDLLNSLTTWA
ncbi:uncharacterized protein [Littorina saxatilis]|uniref:uncharacterized protein n=1 Tax=Littorina saxatilis TaxID=31220 RepID=UPI0038B49C44